MVEAAVVEAAVALAVARRPPGLPCTHIRPASGVLLVADDPASSGLQAAGHSHWLPCTQLFSSISLVPNRAMYGKSASGVW